MILKVLIFFSPRRGGLTSDRHLAFFLRTAKALPTKEPLWDLLVVARTSGKQTNASSLTASGANITIGVGGIAKDARAQCIACANPAWSIGTSVWVIFTRAVTWTELTEYSNDIGASNDKSRCCYDDEYLRKVGTQSLGIVASSFMEHYLSYRQNIPWGVFV